MANLEELAAEVRNDGYSEVNAEAKVCQDIVLKAISEGLMWSRKAVNSSPD